MTRIGSKFKRLFNKNIETSIDNLFAITICLGEKETFANLDNNNLCLAFYLQLYALISNNGNFSYSAYLHYA